jgi:hypothetical protein
MVTMVIVQEVIFPGFIIRGVIILYMRILSSVYADLRKLSSIYRASVYAHFGFRKCAYTEAKMHIYETYLPYMRILASVYPHLRKPKCAYTEALFRI